MGEGVNGHDRIPKPQPPAGGSLVTLEPRRIGLEGNRLLGNVEALGRWAQMFQAYADRTLDLREKKILSEVAKALDEDAEKHKMMLAEIAARRGGATIVTDDDGDE